MKILVVNCGSSSIKYQIFNMSNESALASGLLERIGESSSRLTHRWQEPDGDRRELIDDTPVADHREGFERVVSAVRASGVVGDEGDLFGIGHRVVHGGEAFREPTLIDDRVVQTIREMIPLAPLHNPANLVGIEVALERRPDVPQVAVFDTAFHQTMPPHSFHYALPRSLYEDHHVRRYGFHGTSHRYVAKGAAAHLGRPLQELNLITLHLGNGASATAIQGGKSVDTSMGLTPLEGLIMGTRCGDLDPGVHVYLAKSTGKSMDDVEGLLNKESGLKGICGANDMREVKRLADGGDASAQLALDMYCYRIRKYIGAYYASLGSVDAIVFTGGIGENAAFIRKGVCEGLEGLGISLHDGKNEGVSGTVAEIQAESGGVKILVIPTNEELEIARQTMDRVRAAP